MVDEIVIESKPSAKHYFRELWSYRELFLFLAWRDIIVRYKQTVLGVSWALIRPFLTMIVLTVVFGKVARLPAEGNAPYAVMTFAALLPWQFFSNALTQGSGSLLANAGMLQKVYFPRIIMPASSLGVSVVDFLISFLILVGLMIWYRFVPSWRFVTLPFLTMFALLAAWGPSLIVSALNVKFRDFKYIVPFVVQFGLYASPVGFSSTVVPEKWRFWYSLNPMVGVIDGFRWAILGGDSNLYVPGMIVSLSIVVVLAVLGFAYFRKVEAEFADII